MTLKNNVNLKSKTEKIVYDYLKEKYKSEKIICNKSFSWSNNKLYDIILCSSNIIIEIDGPHHFEQVSNWKSPEYNRSNDIFKMGYAIKNNYVIIRICQEDVYNDTYDWKKDLDNAISLVKQKQVQFLAKDDKIYDLHKKSYGQLNSIDWPFIFALFGIGYYSLR